MKALPDLAGNTLLAALAATDSLVTFRRIPEVHQDRFIQWVDNAQSEDSRWRRIDALVLAMRISCIEEGEEISLASDDLRVVHSETQAASRYSVSPELSDELRKPELFDILQSVIDEFLRARDESSVEETLQITEAFFAALREADCLDLFVLLPHEDQARFLRWIGSAGSVALRSKRIGTFNSALKTSPLDMGRDS